MSKRTQELYEERRQQIIDGALQVFATKGFRAATNRDIATAAGINSPGLIYHYFAGKDDLLLAVIEKHAPPMQLLGMADEFMKLPAEEGLRRFGRLYLNVMRDAQVGSCVRLIMGEALRSTEFARRFGMIGPARVFGLLERFFQAKMEEGSLRCVDPAVAVRCFVGPLMSYIMARFILPESIAIVSDGEALLETHIAVFLQGMKTPES